MPVISLMHLSREVRRSSMEGIAEVASGHIAALSWKRSVVSGSLQSILKILWTVSKVGTVIFHD